MDAIASAVLNKIYLFTINFLRVKLIESIEEGDASLEKLRGQLQNQFERLHDKINKLLIEPLRTAEQNVRLGMAHLDINERDEALHHFRQAQQNAIAAITTATSFEGKMIATRIQLLCVFHIRGYFTESCDPVGLNTILDTVFQQLCSLPEVQSALEGRTKGRSLFRMVTGSGGRLKEVNIVSAVLDLQKQLRVYTGGDHPIMLKDGNALNPMADLRSTFSTREKFSAKTFVSIQCVNGKIYTTDEETNIRVYDAETTMLIVKLQAHIGAERDKRREGNLMITSKSFFYTSFDSTVLSEWDVNTYKLLSTIDVATFSEVKNRFAGQGILAATITAAHIYLVLTEDTNVYVIDLNKRMESDASYFSKFDSSVSLNAFRFEWLSAHRISRLQISNGKLLMFTYELMYELDLNSHDCILHSFSGDGLKTPVELYQKYAKPDLGLDPQAVVRAASYGYHRAIIVDCNYVYAAVDHYRSPKIEQWDIRTNQSVNKRILNTDRNNIRDIIIVGSKLYCLTWIGSMDVIFI